MASTRVFRLACLRVAEGARTTLRVALERVPAPSVDTRAGTAAVAEAGVGECPMDWSISSSTLATSAHSLPAALASCSRRLSRGLATSRFRGGSGVEGLGGVASCTSRATSASAPAPAPAPAPPVAPGVVAVAAVTPSLVSLPPSSSSSSPPSAVSSLAAAGRDAAPSSSEMAVMGAGRRFEALLAFGFVGDGERRERKLTLKWRPPRLSPPPPPAPTSLSFREARRRRVRASSLRATLAARLAARRLSFHCLTRFWATCRGGAGGV